MNHEIRTWMRPGLLGVGLLGAIVLAPEATAQPAGTAFTYQGRLSDAGSPANGPYDFQLVLYTAPVGGSQVGPVVTLDDIAVVDGLFTVTLEFGANAFDGDARFLEIGVRPGASTGAYTLLGARQELTPAPHSVWAACPAPTGSWPSGTARPGRARATPTAGGRSRRWGPVPVSREAPSPPPARCRSRPAGSRRRCSPMPP